MISPHLPRLLVQSIVLSIVDKFNFELSKGVEYLAVEDLTIAPKRFGFIDFFIPGVIGMTAMTTSIFTSVSISARYKQNGIFHKLATTPLKRYEWILSRTIYNVLISYLGMAVMMLMGMRNIRFEDDSGRCLFAHGGDGFSDVYRDRNDHRKIRQRPRRRRRSGKRHNFSYDVSVRHLLPAQPNATVPSNHRTGSPTHIRE